MAQSSRAEVRWLFYGWKIGDRSSERLQKLQMSLIRKLPNNLEKERRQYVKESLASLPDREGAGIAHSMLSEAALRAFLPHVIASFIRQLEIIRLTYRLFSSECDKQHSYL
jgi:hypothetical protein